MMTVTLSETIAAEVKRIAEVLDLSPDDCVEYLIECCLKLYDDTGGDTMRLVGLAEGIQYPTPDEAEAVAERLEAEAAQNHLADPQNERLICVELVKELEGWNFKTDHLRGDKWKGIDDPYDDPPTFF